MLSLISEPVPTLSASEPTRLRILVLCEGDAETYDSWSGISRSVLLELRRRGHTVTAGDVDLYGLQRLLVAAGEFSPDRRRWWVRHHLMARPFMERSRNAARLLADGRASFDVILQFGATFLVDPAPVPVVLYCDGNIALSRMGAAGGESDAALLRPDEVEGIWEREAEVYRKASRILAISDRLRQSFIDDFSIAADRVRTIFAGPNFDVTRIPPPSDARKSSSPTILFVGRQFQRKGGDVLLSAFRLVTERIPDARLVIVGPSDLRVDQKGVEVAGLLDKGTDEGWEGLVSAYSEAHVFCLPSRYEGLSIAVMEAMLFGLPCISTFTEWSRPETIEDGRTGLVVPLDNPQALAEAMCALLQDPGRARAMGMAGRERARSVFSWHAVVEKMEQELLGAITGVRSGS